MSLTITESSAEPNAGRARNVGLRPDSGHGHAVRAGSTGPGQQRGGLRGDARQERIEVTHYSRVRAETEVDLVRQRDDGHAQPAAPISAISARRGPARRAVKAALQAPARSTRSGQTPAGGRPADPPSAEGAASEVAQQRVEHSRVAGPQAQRGVRTDAAKAPPWIGLVQRQEDDEERVAIGGLGALRLAVEADGHLHRNGPARIAVALPQPPHTTGQEHQHDIVDGGSGTSAFAARASLPSGRVARATMREAPMTPSKGEGWRVLSTSAGG